MEQKWRYETNSGRKKTSKFEQNKSVIVDCLAVLISLENGLEEYLFNKFSSSSVIGKSSNKKHI